jgi:hypothetical protein
VVGGGLNGGVGHELFGLALVLEDASADVKADQDVWDGV